MPRSEEKPTPRGVQDRQASSNSSTGNPKSDQKQFFSSNNIITLLRDKRENTLIFYQILSTYSLTKCMENSLENLYVKVDTSRVNFLFVTMGSDEFCFISSKVVVFMCINTANNSHENSSKYFFPNPNIENDNTCMEVVLIHLFCRCMIQI